MAIRFAPTANEYGADSVLISFGSGGGSRAADARAAGRGGRRRATPRQVASARGRARRLAATPGRGRRARQQTAAEVERQLGGRLTQRQLAQIRNILRTNR